MRAPLYSITPGIAYDNRYEYYDRTKLTHMLTVRVVNSYAAVSDTVCVVLLRRVDCTFQISGKFNRTEFVVPFRQRGSQSTPLGRLLTFAHRNQSQRH
jgi:hypothetical protein